MITPKADIALPLEDDDPDRKEAEEQQEDGFQDSKAGAKRFRKIYGMGPILAGLDGIDRRSTARD